VPRTRSVSSLLEWDNDADLIAKFVAPSPNDEDCSLSPVAHDIICRFIAGILAEREELRGAVGEVQKAISDGTQVDFKLLDAAINAIVADVDTDDGGKEAGTGDEVADDDEYVPSDVE